MDVNQHAFWTVLGTALLAGGAVEAGAFADSAADASVARMGGTMRIGSGGNYFAENGQGEFAFMNDMNVSPVAAQSEGQLEFDFSETSGTQLELGLDGSWGPLQRSNH